MSRLLPITTTICTVAVLFANQFSVVGQELSAADDDAGVVRIVSHAKSNQKAPGLIPQVNEARPIQSVQSVSSVKAIPVARHRNHHPSQLGPVQTTPSYGYSYGGYPQLNAPLYPSPQPNTPTYAGGTAITNQAFAPHEMLYPHQYKAMYGPYYYKVRGRWYLTPKGVRSHDTWELQGTEVSVKYRSHYRPFSFYMPPSTRW